MSLIIICLIGIVLVLLFARGKFLEDPFEFCTVSIGVGISFLIILQSIFF